MPWFVCCDAARIFFDREGDVNYVAEVKKHECKPIDENLEHEAATWSSADSRVANFQHQSRWRGSLGSFSLDLHGPIMADPNTAKAVIVYHARGFRFPKGAVTFDIFLPKARFKVVAPHIERLLYSMSPVQMLVTVGFGGFRRDPADWTESQIPTREQFLAADHLSDDFRPYVAEEVEFAFARTFPLGTSDGSAVGSSGGQPL